MLGAVLGTRNTVVNKTHWGPALKKLLNFGGSTWEKVLTSPETRESPREESHLSPALSILHTTRKIFLNHKTENVIYSLALFHQWLLCALLRKIQVALAWPGSALRDLASRPSPTVSLTLCSPATPAFFQYLKHVSPPASASGSWHLLFPWSRTRVLPPTSLPLTTLASSPRCPVNPTTLQICSKVNSEFSQRLPFPATFVTACVYFPVPSSFLLSSFPQTLNKWTQREIENGKLQ